MTKRLGLLIATAGYADPQLPDVRASLKHINDLAEVLQSAQIGGFTITVLIDPTVEAARSAILSLLASREPDDVVLLYVIGHFIQQTDGSLFLALRETTRSDVENTALPAAFVQLQLQETAAKNQMIILDGRFGSIAGAEGPTDRDSQLNAGRNFHVPGRDQAILATSDYLSFCLIGSHYVAVRSGQPPLAESIARGLRSGEADEKGDRRVTVNGLLSYLNKEIGSVRKDEMLASWVSEGAGDLLVAVYPDKAIDQAKERPTAKPEMPVSARAAGSSLFDDNVKFTAYRPAILVPGEWRRMMVFMHLDEAATLIEIETRARQILGAEFDDYRDVVDSRFPMVRESEITLVPEASGIRFIPPRRSFSWASGVRVHEESFFMHAPFSLAGKLARGRISIFFGQLLLAEIPLSLRVAAAPAQLPPPKEEETWAKGVAKRFRKVFASYSNLDVKVIEAMQRQSRAIGYEYLREVVKLRSIQKWNERLLAKVAEADVFQLFWSRNAAHSAHVEKEWRHAIALQREAFVRPAYWELPMPDAPEPLRRLHFYLLPSIHPMADRRKGDDADRDAVPVGSKQNSSNRPVIFVPPPEPSTSEKSQTGSTEQIEETSPPHLPDEMHFGKTDPVDLPSTKPTADIEPQKDHGPADLSSKAGTADAGKIPKKRILGWSAILGTLVGGFFVIFLSINSISRSWLKPTHPNVGGMAQLVPLHAPSGMPLPYATPSPTAGVPVLTTPIPSPSQALVTPTASPIQPLTTPTASPIQPLPTPTPNPIKPFVTPSADDTALNEGSQGPMPVGGLNGPESIIQMKSETIDVQMGKKFSDVDCQYVFRSHKTTRPAFQLVGFPDFGASVQEAERRNHKKNEAARYEIEDSYAGPLQNVQTFVDGQQTKTELKYGWVSAKEGYYAFAPESDQDKLLMAWHTVPVTFPPDKDVIVERKYRAPNGGQAIAKDQIAILFYYSTATGGVWKDDIERMEVNVHLRDGITVDSLEWLNGRKQEEIQQDACSPDKPEWKVISPTELQLIWEHFEPRTNEHRRLIELVTQASKPD
jgi:hypothetical protein